VQVALGDNQSAIRNLEMARPILGLTEDVRRAMGQAELQNNRPARAAALWIQVMRDNPEWERHLRPLVASALERLAPARGPEADQLVGISTALAGQARRGDAFNVAALRDAYRDTFTKALDACLAGQCELGTGLLAAYDTEQGLLLALAGRQKRDETLFYEGTVRLASGWRQFGGRGAEVRQ
jgi:hypothetical protein